MHLISANHAHHSNNTKWFSETSFSTGSGFILLSNSNYQFSKQTLSIKMKQIWNTTVIYRVFILKTQCTQNSFTLKYFDLKICFIFSNSSVFLFLEFPGLQYCQIKQNLGILAQAQSQENLFSTQILNFLSSLWPYYYRWN